MDSPDVSPLVSLVRKSRYQFVKLLGKAARNDTFRHWYAVAAVGVLLATTVLWAVLGARLQSHNADQLSDPYMFSSWATFHGAIFPGAHTFLLKWPIFLLLAVVGINSVSLLVATVGVVLVTIATLAFMLYKIDRRPLVFGTICLGLSLALLLVPAQPYAGGILPVNMAMLTTRNLEYAVYLVVLVLLARANRFRSRSFIAGAVLLAVLIASDKLFLSVSAGGALLALVIYALFSNWRMVKFAVRWLSASIVAAIGAMAILLAISASHLTHLAGGTAATPYGVIHTVKNLALGVGYAGMGLLTNIGANPAYDGTILAKLPGNLVHRLWSLSGFAYLAAFGVFLYVLLLVWRMVRPSFRAAARADKPSVGNLLSLSLLWSTVAAFGVFIATDHYYAVDARYLTISLFALAITAAVELRQKHWQAPKDLLLIACALLVAVAIAAFTALHISSQQTTALNTVSQRNALVVKALKHHKVDVLVGDYWRVLPIKLASPGSLIALPLSGCTQTSTLLTSSAWHPDLTKHSFAYLVTLDGSLTNFPNCSLPQITVKYGRPTTTKLIAGSLKQPAEALLFYDQGSHKPVAKHVTKATPIIPVGLQQFTDAACDQPTILNIVAHEDDDLLFLSPDLISDIKAGNCVRTVYLTAGDAGQGKDYWVTRQLGAEAAYSEMLGIADVWSQHTVTLAPGEYVTIATPRDSGKASLIFFNLPDGNLQGGGFSTYGQQSLTKLYRGSLTSLQTVDSLSVYTSGQLINALEMLMDAYQPAAIHTQADVWSGSYPDHSDHITTGQFAEAAASAYDQQHFGGALTVPVTRYIGYPIHGYMPNISQSEQDEKVDAFFAYSHYDGGTCHTLALCSSDTTYGIYLLRQYKE